MGLLVDLRAAPNVAPILAYRNAVFAGELTASDAIANFPPSAARSYATYEGWRPSNADSSITVTLPAAQAVDYMGAVCIGGSPTTTIRAFTSIDGVNFVARGAGQQASEGAILWLFDEVASVTQVRFQVLQGNIEGFRLAVFMAGQRTAMERNIYVGHTPITYGRTVETTSNRSESGQFLGRIVRRKTLRTSLTLSNLTPGFYRTTLDPAFVALQDQPAFWSWRPDANFVNEVAYAWMNGDPSVVNQRPNGMMQASFDLSSGPFQ